MCHRCHDVQQLYYVSNCCTTYDKGLIVIKCPKTLVQTNLRYYHVLHTHKTTNNAVHQPCSQRIVHMTMSPQYNLNDAK
jgi:hypothetical protein